MSICLAITDADWALTKDVFSVIGTLVSAAAVAVAFYFGKEGLSTWRKQLKGTTDHELARRILIELHGYKDAMHSAREIGFWGEEIASDDLSPDDEHDSADQRQYKVMSRAYRYRFRIIERYAAPLRASLLEADLLWSERITEKFSVLFQMEKKLWIAVRRYLRAIDPDLTGDIKERYIERWQSDRWFVQDQYTNDDFRDGIEAEVNSIEAAVKRRLL